MTNEKLIANITALINLDAANALVPHGIGGHARTLLKEAADALQAMELAPYATSALENLTTKREKVILLTRVQNENDSLRAQLATQALRLEDANGLLRYVADQRDAALSKLQAMERKPSEWQTIESAPKDRAVLLYCMCLYELGHFNGLLMEWVCNYDHRILKNVTHWMPLPPPPNVKGE